MPGLQEGPGLPGHLGGHRDYGGPGPVRQGFEPLPVQGLPRRRGSKEGPPEPVPEGPARPPPGPAQDPGPDPHLLHEDLHPDPQPGWQRHGRGRGEQELLGQEDD